MNNTTTHSPVPQRFRGAWEIKRFEEVFQRLNGKLHQVPASEYNEHGLHPVIDQGQHFIVAFSNRTDKLFKCPADGVIVFGDHTRTVKYATMDFLIGADGTQLLATQGSNVTQFFFYQLLAKEIPDTGYNRHFKFLKEATWAVPTLAEQRAIAEVLSDVDSLLDALDALIAKKRAVKHAAMQQLLTGATRLPGFSGEWKTYRLPKEEELTVKTDLFSGEWKTYRLGEIASFFKGSGNLLKTDLSLEGNKRCIHYGELFTTYGECITEVLHGTDREGTFFRSLRNDVLMPASDVTPNGLATASCISISDVILGGDILVIRVPEEILNGTFLAYTIRASHNQVMQLVSGTTVFHLYARDMANFRFIAPSVREQNAIVGVLSDMDTEIDALERRRDKVRAIKKAMMQELLTGRVRLAKSA